MSTDTIANDSNTTGTGTATGTEGQTASAKAQQAYGSARDAITEKAGPLAEKARGFAKERPFAAAALAGVVGIAILNTLRGKR
jgi:ElaB/YqjD/DUF883 family membrane-anchored ribosome-binding protein